MSRSSGKGAPVPGLDRVGIKQRFKVRGPLHTYDDFFDAGASSRNAFMTWSVSGFVGTKVATSVSVGAVHVRAGGQALVGVVNRSAEPEQEAPEQRALEHRPVAPIIPLKSFSLRSIECRPCEPAKGAFGRRAAAAWPPMLPGLTALAGMKATPASSRTAALAVH